MRKTVAGPVFIRAGQKVRFEGRLLDGEHYAFMEVFVADNRHYRPSPYIPESKITALMPGKAGQLPMMLPPTTMRLTEGLPVKYIELDIERDGYFHILQEVDLKTTPPSIGSIKFGTTIERIIGTIRGRLLAKRWPSGSPFWSLRR